MCGVSGFHGMRVRKSERVARSSRRVGGRARLFRPPVTEKPKGHLPFLFRRRRRRVNRVSSRGAVLLLKEVSQPIKCVRTMEQDHPVVWIKIT